MLAPGVRYTVIETRYDEVVTPYTSAFLSGPDVTNITLQDHCILDLADHLTTPYDSIALRYVLNALDPAHAVAPGCRPVIAGVGGWPDAGNGPPAPDSGLPVHALHDVRHGDLLHVRLLVRRG